MAVQASQMKVVDLTAVDVSDYETTINATIEVLEADDWVIQSQIPVHVVDNSDGNAKFLIFIAYQKHEVL